LTLSKLLKISNYLLVLTWTMLLSTGLILNYKLPRGPFRNQGKGRGGEELWSMTRHEWGDIHFYLGLSVLFFILLHLYLNHSWFKMLYKQFGATKVWGSLLLLALILVLPWIN